MSRAQELLVSGRTFTTERRPRSDWCIRLVAADTLMEHVLAYAADVRGQLLAGLDLQHQRPDAANDDQSFLDTVHDAETRERSALASVDFHEGVMSFVERRQPAFAPTGSRRSAPDPVIRAAVPSVLHRDRPGRSIDPDEAAMRNDELRVRVAEVHIEHDHRIRVVLGHGPQDGRPLLVRVGRPFLHCGPTIALPRLRSSHQQRREPSEQATLTQVRRVR